MFELEQLNLINQGVLRSKSMRKPPPKPPLQSQASLPAARNPPAVPSKTTKPAPPPIDRKPSKKKPSLPSTKTSQTGTKASPPSMRSGSVPVLPTQHAPAPPPPPPIPPPSLTSPASPQQPSAQPADLLASIRNAGGVESLRTSPNKTQNEVPPPKTDMMGELRSKLGARRSHVMPGLSSNIPFIPSDSDSNTE